MDPSNKSYRLESPLFAQTWKPLSVVPGKKSGLSHFGVKTEVIRDLPSNLQIVCHALTVQTVIGLLQAGFRDLRFLINNKFVQGNSDIELSISNQIDTGLLCIQSATWLYY